MIRLAEVRKASIGEALGLRPGTALLRINGAEVRDAVDLLFLEAEERLELEAEGPGGDRVVYDIEKPAGESLGLVPEPDKIRRCTNACAFCFVKGNPKRDKLRASLYIKDDDYRLSFLYGHYVTLTNLREEDWERIVEQRLSPLYVSVHATEPDVRLAMLKNPRSAEIGRHLDRLQAGGIRFHAQVVLCPELNDGPVLDRTIEDLWARGEDVLSLSVVPVGLTAHNADRGIRPLEPEECRRALAQVETARARARRARGHGWCYAADELFLQADHPLPGSDYFDEPDLAANGVGAISRLRDEVRRGLGTLPRWDGHRILLVTGTSMGPHLRALGREIAEACGARIDTAVRPNGLYGPMVTTAGLLSGRDHLEAIRPRAETHDVALFSRSALNERERFLDDLSLEELRAAVPGIEICPSDNVVDALMRA